MRNTLPAFGFLVLLSVATAAHAAEGPAKVPPKGDLTLGAIQRSIKSGMSTTEIIEVAGSPNLVTRAKNGKESWVYDRFSTESSEEGIQAGGGGAGAGSSLLGVIGLGGHKKKSSTSQRTLMLIVTFGSDGMVESFSYRSSKF